MDQELDDLGRGKPNHVAVGAVEPTNETRRGALDSVGTRFVEALAAVDVPAKRLRVERPVQRTKMPLSASSRWIDRPLLCLLAAFLLNTLPAP